MKRINRWSHLIIAGFFLAIGCLFFAHTVIADRKERRLEAKIKLLSSELVEARKRLYQVAGENCSCDICVNTEEDY